MPDFPNQPRKDDLVLGGQFPPSADSAVLGGLEGVKRQLNRGNSSVVVLSAEHRIAALKAALKYGDAGLDLLIQVLQDETTQLKWAAYSLLRERKEPRVELALREYNPWRLFECLCTLKGHSYVVTSAGMVAARSDSVTSVAISSDRQTLVSGRMNGSITVWNLPTEQVSRTLEGNSLWVNSVAISPDGQTLISSNGDSTLLASIIKVWNLSTGQDSPLLGGRLHVSSVAISPDGQTLVGGSDDGTIKVWNLLTKQEIFTLEALPCVNSVTISLDGQTIISGCFDGSIQVWDLATGRKIRTLEGPSCVNPAAISPDGQTLVSGSNDGLIKVWDLPTSEEICTLEGHANGVYSVAISPNGQTIVSGSYDGSIKVWGVP